MKFSFVENTVEKYQDKQSQQMINFHIVQASGYMKQAKQVKK